MGLAPWKALPAIAVALAFTLVPAAAEADIVYEKGADIWAMEDDGTDGRVLAKAADVPDMDGGIGSPHVDPTGKTVAFTGNTQRHKVVDYGTCYIYGPYYTSSYPCWTWHYGFNATGVYLLKDGQITRQSPDPAYCHNCTMSDYSPELSAGATRHAYSFMHCQGTRSAGDYTCNASLGIRGEGEGTFGTVCGEGTAASFDPAINPKNANQVAYVGCSVSRGEDTLEALHVAEAGRANEHPVACDDSSISDPSFSPAGDKLVTSQSGDAPGLWIYDPNVNHCVPGATGVNALVNPDTDNISFSSPRFMGSAKLVFSVGTKSGDTWVYDLYTIPASCSACQFPSAATKLTEGGESTSPAWTAAALAVVPPPDRDADGVPDASDECPAVRGTQADGCPPPRDRGPGPDPDPDDDPDVPGDGAALVLGRLSVKPAAFKPFGSGGSIAAAKGAAVIYRLSRPAGVTFKVQRKTKRRGCRRGCIRWQGAGKFSHSGAAGTNRFMFTGRVGSETLRRGSYRLAARATDAAGTRSRTVRAPFRIVR